MRPTVLAAALAVLTSPVASAQTRSPVHPETEWSLAAVGDVIMNRRLFPFDHADDPGFHDLAEVIRSADASFMNLEQSLLRLESFQGWPAAENGGNYEWAPPEVLDDLVAMGFNLFNRANNHTTDYGVAGMLATDRLLDERGLTHAGTGMNLGWASRPGYLDTAKGRIALIGMASSHTTMSRAGAASPDVPGRPGLNPLRVHRRVEAGGATMEALRDVAMAFGDSVPADPSRPLRVLGTTVYPGSRDRVITSVDRRDRARILREIGNAADQADRVVVTSHSHQPGNASVTPPQWMVGFAHDAVDAGGDAFIIHGPHRLRGVEIYRGRPIFYSLGNFVFHNETIDPMPADQAERYGLSPDALAGEIYDARFRVDDQGNPTRGFPTGAQWYRSVVAVCTFRGGEVVEIRFHPIELAWEAPRSQRGTPRLAPPGLGRAIIEHLAALSEPFGTTIRYEEGVGVWRR